MRPAIQSAPRRLMGAAAVVAILVLAVAPDPAVAQSDVRQLLDRIERLERDIRLLNVQLARGQAAPQGAAASAPAVAGDGANPLYTRLEERLNTLEDEMRSLTGVSERLTHSIDEMTRRLDKLVADVDFRLGSVEKSAPNAPAASTSSEASAPPPRPTQPQTLGTLTESDLRRLGPGSAPAASTPGAQPPAAAPAAPAPSPEAQARALLPEGTAAERYNYAQRLVAQAKYDDAETALRAFLQLHGNDRLALNARYWLGETYYVRKNFQMASQVFLENYQTAPRGEKAPDNLLKLGMSLANLEKKREACATFEKLGQEFPGVPEHVKRTIAAERQRAGCS